MLCAFAYIFVYFLLSISLCFKTCVQHWQLLLLTSDASQSLNQEFWCLWCFQFRNFQRLLTLWKQRNHLKVLLGSTMYPKKLFVCLCLKTYLLLRMSICFIIYPILHLFTFPYLPVGIVNCCNAFNRVFLITYVMALEILYCGFRSQKLKLP